MHDVCMLDMHAPDGMGAVNSLLHPCTAQLAHKRRRSRQTRSKRKTQTQNRLLHTIGVGELSRMLMAASLTPSVIMMSCYFEGLLIECLVFARVYSFVGCVTVQSFCLVLQGFHHQTLCWCAASTIELNVNVSFINVLL